MFEFEISVQNDEITPAIERLLPRIRRPRVLMQRWSRRAVQMMQRNARRKTKGGRFWHELASSIREDWVSAQAAGIGVWHVAAAQKQYGGVIQAREAGALTIPIAEEAKGKRASEFTMGGRGLFRVRKKNGTELLGYRAGGRFRALFVLLQSVRQNAEPWLPEDDELLSAGLVEAERLVDEVWQ